MHMRMEALSGMVGNRTTFQTQESQQVCENLLHTPHGRTTAQAAENTANKKRGTWEFGIYHATVKCPKHLRLQLRLRFGQVSD